MSENCRVTLSDFSQSRLARVFFCLLLPVIAFLPLKSGVCQSVPIASYEWKPVRIGAGGFVTGMTVHPLDSKVRYARTDVGNGYRWDVALKTWLPMIVRDVEKGTGLDASLAAVPANLGVESLQVDPSNLDIVYMSFPLTRSNDVAATHPRSAGALYKSTDRGVTFIKTGLEVPMSPNGETRGFGERIAVDPLNSNVVYYGSVRNGLHHSFDGGATWSKPVSGPPATSDVLNICFGQGAGGGAITVNGQIRSKIVYATAFQGDVFQSVDGGQTWTNLTAGTTLSGFAAFSITDKEGRFYVVQRGRGSYFDNKGQIQYYYFDTNRFWRYEAGVWTQLQVAGANGSTFGGWGNLKALTIDPNNSRRMFAINGGGAVSRSLDGGTSWVLIANSFVFANTFAWLPQVDVGDYRSNGGIIIDRDGRLWSPQGNEGVLTAVLSANDSETSVSPVQWMIESVGIEELVGHDVVIPPGSGDKPVISVHDATAFFIDDPDQFTARQSIELQDQLISNGIGVAYCPNAPDFVVLSASDINRTSSGRNYSGYSTNGGRTWTPFESRPIEIQCGTIAVSRREGWGLGQDRIVILPANNRPPYYSHDGGKTWSQSTGLPVYPPGAVDKDGNSIEGQSSETYMWNFSLRQRLLIADPFVANKFYLSPLGNDRFYISNDGGVSFTQTGGVGLPPNGRFHSQMQANHVVQNDLWFCDGWEGAHGGINPRGLFRSTNGGMNFSRLSTVDFAITFALGKGSGKSGDAPFTVYVYGKVKEDRVWGIFRSTDEGATWTRVAFNPTGLFDRPSMMAASWDTFGLLYVTYGGTSAVYGNPTPTVPPTISRQPANAEAATGTSVSLSVVASQWPTFQWERQDFGTTDWVPIANATGSTYTFSVGTQDDRARFRVVATNVAGSVTSEAAELLVNRQSEAAEKLTGTPIGSPGARAATPTSTGDKAFDGLTTTFYDAANASGDWTGLDLGEGVSRRITRIRFFPRLNQDSAMVNGRFQGSNDPTFTTGVVTLATVKNLALPGQWTVLDKFPSAEGFRYVRYVGGNNSRTQVAEIEFFGVPAESRVATPEFSLSSGTYGGTQSISISTATPSATIRYTVDGSMPSETSTLYEGPVSVASSLRLRAIAYSNSLPYSSIRTADYVIFDPVVKLSGRHIGSPGSWSNLPHLTGDKAFDGLTSTIYDARNASGDWTGLDLGSGVAKQVVRIRFWERTNWTGRMRGGKFQGSSSPDFTSGVIDLATVTVSTPGKWVELASIASTAGFRYLRYIGPNNSHCNVAEIEFYGLDGEPLAPGARFTRWVTDLATPSASLTEADLLATADPDGDGIANLVEYVMGTSPFSPNGAETLPALKVNSPDGMTFTFTRNPALTDITYTVEVSSALHDPASWTPIAASVAGAATVAISGRSAVVETGSDLKLVTVSDQTSGSDGSKRFFRLRVSH